MAQDLQKHKIIAAGILTACTAVAVFLFIVNTQRTISRPFAQGNPQPATRNPQPEITIADADADGLTDQEEIETYGTNQSNPDSDADGYMDGEEVAQNTNPSEAESFPNEPSIASLTNEQNQNYSQAMIGTLLNDIAQNDRLFYTEATGTEEIQLHTEYGPEDVEQLASLLLSGFLENKDIVNIRRVDDAELNLSSDNSTQATKKYLAAIFEIVSDQSAAQNLDVFFSKLQSSLIVQGGNLTPELKTMAKYKIIPALAIIEKRLRSLETPSQWKEIHKDEIAIIAGQKLAMTYLAAGSQSDPMQSIYGLAMLNKVNDDWNAWQMKASEILDES